MLQFQIYQINICIKPRLWREACYLQPPNQSIIYTTQIFVTQRRLNRCYVATAPRCDCKLQFVSLLSEPPWFWVISHLFSNLFVQEQPWSDSMWQRTEGGSDPLSQRKTWLGYTLTHQANTHTHNHKQEQCRLQQHLHSCRPEPDYKHTHALIRTGPKKTGCTGQTQALVQTWKLAQTTMVVVAQFI